jgi:hypothetical protein
MLGVVLRASRDTDRVEGEWKVYKDGRKVKEETTMFH